MDKSLLKKAAIQSVALMIAVITVSFALQQYQAVAISASNMVEEGRANTTDQQEGIELLESGISFEVGTVSLITGSVLMAKSLAELEVQVEDNIFTQLSDTYLVIKKPEAENLTLELEDIYINKSIRISLTGLRRDDISSEMIMRVRGDEFYLGEPRFTEMITREVDENKGTLKEVITKDFGNDLSHKITVTTQQDETSDLYNAQLLIELDRVYAYFIYEDANYYFIDLRKPTDVYDKVLVIDAGHGGKDAGALSSGEKYYEKNINLDIVLQLKELLDQEDIKVYYTRIADNKVFLRPRVTLANAVDCDYFISVHCNSYETTSPNGTEVLYYDTNFKGVSSRDLAKLFSEELGKTVELKNRGIIEKHGEDIFIMDKSLVPSILIETGYLSNNNDLTYLTDEQNQKVVAQGIFNGIIRAYNELPVLGEGQ